MMLSSDLRIMLNGFFARVQFFRILTSNQVDLLRIHCTKGLHGPAGPYQLRRIYDRAGKLEHSQSAFQANDPVLPETEILQNRMMIY